MKNAYMYCEEANEGTSVWKFNYNGLFKTYSLDTITDKSTNQPLILLSHDNHFWWKGKGTSTSWKMSIHGNKIETNVRGYTNQAEDSEFIRGGYGFFTVSQPQIF